VPAEARADAVRAALGDEAFALHFLEDSFAAGHVAGNWGKSATRKGAHDFYNERGLALTTWNGDRFVAQGDAFMKPADADRAANAVRDSLAQLVDSFQGKVQLADPDDAKVLRGGLIQCLYAGAVPIRRRCPPGYQPRCAHPHADTVPALGKGPGELPRFRSEMGAFVGLSTGFRGGLLTHGFGSGEDGVSTTSGIELAGRFGIGMDGVVDQSSDGLIFVEGGVREDTNASVLILFPPAAQSLEGFGYRFG